MLETFLIHKLRYPDISTEADLAPIQIRQILRDILHHSKTDLKISGMEVDRFYS